VTSYDVGTKICSWKVKIPAADLLTRQARKCLACMGVQGVPYQLMYLPQILLLSWR